MPRHVVPTAEALIGHDRLVLAGRVGVPADTHVEARVELGDVGFDVEDRRAVEQIKVGHQHAARLDAQDAKQRDRDRIWPRRRARREDSARLSIQERNHLELRRCGAVQVADEQQVREPVEILQSRPELGLQLQAALRPLRARRLDGHARSLRERAAHRPDRTVDQVHLSVSLEAEE